MRERITLPTGTSIRFLVGRVDVLHCFTVAGAGLKVDAAPGVLIQAARAVETPGLYKGLCSEICGLGHSQIPIVIEFVPVEVYGVSTCSKFMEEI